MNRAFETIQSCLPQASTVYLCKWQSNLKLWRVLDGAVVQRETFVEAGKLTVWLQILSSTDVQILRTPAGFQSETALKYLGRIYPFRGPFCLTQHVEDLNT